MFLLVVSSTGDEQTGQQFMAFNFLELNYYYLFQWELRLLG